MYPYIYTHVSYRAGLHVHIHVHVRVYISDIPRRVSEDIYCSDIQIQLEVLLEVLL